MIRAPGPVLEVEWRTTDANYGRVQLQCWSGLHAIPQNREKKATRQARPIVRGTLIRLEVERLPKPTKAPVPLWLWWWGPDLPDLEAIWRVYVARFSFEHTYRFFKQVRKLDDPQAPFKRGRGSLDLVGDSGVCPTASGTSLGPRSSPALAGSSTGGENDACSRPSRLFAPAADVGPSGVHPKTLWTLAWTTERAAICPGEADACDQIDRVIT
jgi:hypothetical protein